MNTIPLGFNQHLNELFFQEFSSERPTDDAVFSRVERISLHSLYTGVLIVECKNPSETKYRQIPSHQMAQLRIAVQNNASEDVDAKIQEIFREIRNNPNLYYPHPFFILETRLTLPLAVLNKIHFERQSLNYQLDANSNPNTLFKIMDLIFLDEPSIPNPLCRAQYLVKVSDTSQVTNLVMQYHEFLGDHWDRYMDIVSEMKILITTQEAFSSSQRRIVPSQEFRDKINAELSDPSSMFTEYVNAMNRIDGLSEEHRSIPKILEILSHKEVSTT